MTPPQLGLNGGADVNITGKGFGNTPENYSASLSINNVFYGCDIRYWSINEIVCRVPKLVDGIARVVVRSFFLFINFVILELNMR